MTIPFFNDTNLTLIWSGSIQYSAMKKKINWDVLGIGASVACAIHCALLPLILTSLPLFGINIINNNAFEYFMIGLACCIGAFSLYHGKKHHHGSLPLIIFSCGMAFLVAKQIWPSYHILLLFPAVTLIVIAHYFNYKYCRKNDSCISKNINSLTQTNNTFTS